MRPKSAKQLINTIKQSAIVNDKAFRFLASCDGATRDWTVAEPLMNMPPYLQNKHLTASHLMPISPVGGSKLLVSSATEYSLNMALDVPTTILSLGMVR